MAGALPNLLIVGAAKSGTTSLHHYLAAHPDVFMSEVKELKFFDRADWRLRVDWYRRQFPTDRPVRGESSPTYSLDPWFPDVPARISELVPDAKIIYLVRDPVERLLAHYVEMRALEQERRPLEAALRDPAAPDNRLVLGSRYAHQLGRYREHFADEQLLVLDHHDLLHSRGETLRETFSFLEVDPSFASPAFDARHNARETKLQLSGRGRWLHERGLLQPLRAGSRRLPVRLREALKMPLIEPMPELEPELDTGTEHALRAHLAEDVARLRAMTGKAFPHWSL